MEDANSDAGVVSANILEGEIRASASLFNAFLSWWKLPNPQY